MKLLAIETSCDETAAAIIESDGVSVSVLSSVVSSQAELHAAWGGVIPNLAAREHVKNIIPVVESALHEALATPGDIDCIAVTEGPGLIPALLVGVSAAKALAIAWQKPLIGINHLEGHIYANLFTAGAELHFPLLAVIVSGGHTQLILMRDHFQYELLGETDDDAAGEAFDKVAKMLGLPYPGGPEIGKRADDYRTSAERVPAKRFPRPMLNTNDYRFSFSGLKTAVLYSLKKEPVEKLSDPDFIALISHEFQEAIVDTLVGKTERAVQTYQPKTLVIAGGVSANARLRERMKAMIDGYSDCQFLMPPFQYSLDNAAMIGSAAILRYARMNDTERFTLRTNVLSLEPSAHFPLAQYSL
ncbi:MAG: tRNA (adenosine(37)-N6)-threonylcarbamoyltransferase complex transferase subunit TsaD [Candidatus Moraniibacteriota bacterium]